LTTNTYDLAAYQRHVDLYGPECVLETAASDLGRDDVARLAAYIEHRERVSRFHAGQWVHRGQEVRVCEECRLDLPKGASSRMRRHKHCARRIAKRRERAKQTAAY
jgi:hypothetical protein